MAEESHAATPGRSNRLRFAALMLLLAAALALALRLPELGVRPMHNDEGVNALKFGRLWRGQGYRYEASEFHGPALVYATAGFEKLTRAPDFNRLGEARFRLVTVAFGLGLVMLLPLVRDGLGGRAMIWAAVLTAVSPAMVFYSRYYIHETLLVCFTFLAFAAAWRYWRSGKPFWALLAGLGLGLMHATKETFVLALGAAGLSLLLNWAWTRLLDAGDRTSRRPRLQFWPAAAGLGVWLLTAGVLFSSFFSNPAGLWDSARTYHTWLSRAAGESPHTHSWTFYLHRLIWFHPAPGPVWSEAFVLLLAGFGGAAGFRHRGLGGANAGFARFLALYTFLLAAGYSLIPYKTPWCLLGFWHGAILLAGLGATALVESTRTRPARAVVLGLLAVGTAHLGWQAWRAVIPYAADRRNPYVYAQTSPDALNLVERVEALARVHPEGGRMFVQVAAPESDYGPLPWYLRDLEQVAWSAEVPEQPSAPVLILSSEFHVPPDALGAYRMTGYYQLRPLVFFELYVQPGLWTAWLDRGGAGAGR